MHHIVLWKWNSNGGPHVYDADCVNTVARMVRANITRTAHRIVCVTDDPQGITECATFPLWRDCSELQNASGVHLPSCYRRLRLYDPGMQQAMGIARGDRILSLDLDTVIIGTLDDILNTPGRFIGWQLRGAYKPKVFNGSFQMFSGGDLDFIWYDFNPNRSPHVAADAGFRGSDQAWLSMQLVNRDYSVGLSYPDVSSYPLNNRISGHLDFQTRIVFFHGSQKPWQPSTHALSPWVARRWDEYRSRPNAYSTL